MRSFFAAFCKKKARPCSLWLVLWLCLWHGWGMSDPFLILAPMRGITTMHYEIDKCAPLAIVRVE